VPLLALFSSVVVMAGIRTLLEGQQWHPRSIQA